jgi:putative nucleotidyltransferase with HDIG domain
MLFYAILMPGRVLVVDDDPRSRQLLERALESTCRAAEAQLDVAASGEEGLDHLRKHADYAMVLTDRRMPGISGDELLRQAMATHPEAIRILFTGAADDTGPPSETAFRIFLRPVDTTALAGFVAEGLRLYDLEREHREALHRLGVKYRDLERREKLLDVVVRERTRGLEQALHRLRLAYRQAILGLAEAIEAKDPYTKGHCGRVAAYALALARKLGYREEDLEALELASFLHDIGKIGVRDAVLLKPGPLDNSEWDHMRQHPRIGAEIIERIELLRPAMAAIRNHHERWDGTGYPDGIQGEAIPLSARIVAIADAYDTLATDRPYKSAMTREVCYEALRKRAGEWFDPTLVELFIHEDLGAAVYG